MSLDSIPVSPPCNLFKIDTTADFEVCGNCGRRKADHPEIEKSTSTFAGTHVKEAIKTLVKRVSKRFTVSVNGEPCNKFEVDVLATKFGSCKCGFNKKEHEDIEEARAERKRLDSKLHEVKLQEEKLQDQPDRPCNTFNLNLESKGGYGVCVCGFTRQEHQQFTDVRLVGTLKEKKGALTTPKEFT